MEGMCDGNVVYGVACNLCECGIIRRGTADVEGAAEGLGTGFWALSAFMFSRSSADSLVLV